jgi:hypothetical protein
MAMNDQILVTIPKNVVHPADEQQKPGHDLEKGRSSHR